MSVDRTDWCPAGLHAVCRQNQMGKSESVLTGQSDASGDGLKPGGRNVQSNVNALCPDTVTSHGAVSSLGAEMYSQM